MTIISRAIIGAVALSVAVIPSLANAVTTASNFSAVVRANEKAVASYNACGGNNKCQSKVLASVQYRINTASSDSALTPAVQRATTRQLNEIFQRSLGCAAADVGVCAKQNSKTLAALLYRVTNQEPISKT